MDSAKLFCYAKLIGTLAEISWLTSVLVFLKGSKENNFSMWKKKHWLSNNSCNLCNNSIWAYNCDRNNKIASVNHSYFAKNKEELCQRLI